MGTSNISIASREAELLASLKSHLRESNFIENYKHARSRIENDSRPGLIPLEERLDWLDRLAAFPLGQFLMENQGLNGFWTDYLIRPEAYTSLTNLSDDEKLLLNRIPVVLATRERFHIFQNLIQQNLQNNIKIASLPCGVMADIALLNFESLDKLNIIGMDLDFESLSAAHQLCFEQNLTEWLELRQMDAWTLEDVNTFHIMVSNGLTIYEPDHNRVVDFYTRCQRSLIKGGIMIGSFLTPPMHLDPKSPWKMELINPQDLRTQAIVFNQVLQPKFQNYHTFDQMAEILETAGFTDLEFVPDSTYMFPTFIAKK